MIKIKLIREKTWADSLRDYKIFIDNNRLASIAQGETKIIEIASGRHEIYLKVDYCRSRKINFIGENESEIIFRCKGPTGWAIFYSVVFYTHRIKLIKE